MPIKNQILRNPYADNIFEKKMLEMYVLPLENHLLSRDFSRSEATKFILKIKNRNTKKEIGRSDKLVEEISKSIIRVRNQQLWTATSINRKGKINEYS